MRVAGPSSANSLQARSLCSPWSQSAPTAPPAPVAAVARQTRPRICSIFNFRFPPSLSLVAAASPSKWARPNLATSTYGLSSRLDALPPPLKRAPCLLTTTPTEILQRLDSAGLQRKCYSASHPIARPRPRLVCFSPKRKLTSNPPQLLTDNHNQTGSWGGCELTGIPLSGGRHLGNLGSIILAGIAIVTSILLLLKSDRKKAAVGRRYASHQPSPLHHHSKTLTCRQRNPALPHRLHYH